MTDTLLIKDMFFGFTDGKHEFNEVDEDTFVRAFFLPEDLDISSITEGRRFIVSGPRGSGKTTLLRWVAHSLRHERITDFLLFKSEISEQQKQDISRAIGISEISLEGSDKGVFQDFRDFWRIIIISRLCSMILKNSQGVEDIGPAKAVLKLTGLDTSSNKDYKIFPHLLSLMRLRWIDVASGIEWEAGLWGNPPESSAKITPQVLAYSAQEIFKSIKFKRPYFLLIDELEIFYKTNEQFKRDCDIVRDAIVVCEEFRRWTKEHGISANTMIAVRNEVIGAIGARGEEIYKITDDYSLKIDWSARKSSENHPLVRMILKKIPSNFESRTWNIDGIFPEKIFRAPYHQYLTDNTACKPRNLVARLNVIKDKYPYEAAFSQAMFEATEAEYSAKIWKETEYLLGASHSELAIAGLKRVLFAWKGRFHIDEFQARVQYLTSHYPSEMAALLKEGFISMLERMFEYGVVGNVYKDKFLNRNIYIWSFRGEDVFQPHRQMEVQRSLWKHLSIVTAFSKNLE